jgi:hypothetical protein
LLRSFLTCSRVVLSMSFRMGRSMSRSAVDVDHLLPGCTPTGMVERAGREHSNAMRLLSVLCQLVQPFLWGCSLGVDDRHRRRIGWEGLSSRHPGWWLSEEPDRKMSPNVPLETWDSVFRATGFPGCQLVQPFLWGCSLGVDDRHRRRIGWEGLSSRHDGG